MELDQQRVVVTGASSGIGRALLQNLSGHPVQIAAIGRDETRPRGVVESASASQARFKSFPFDLSRQRDLDALFDYAVHKMDRIDIFVAKASFAYWELVGKPGWGRIESIFSGTKRSHE
jgi:NAD(P)-dependent dehydrogenase (short-subunit alcohol dehydrogenase family)